MYIPCDAVQKNALKFNLKVRIECFKESKLGKKGSENSVIYYLNPFLFS